MAMLDSCRGGALREFKETRLHVNVLIVDDDEEDVYWLKRLLGRSRTIGYRVFDRRSLDEGAALAAAADIDLLLVDLLLGVGFSVDRRGLKHPLLNRPFVLLSGLDAPELAQTARDAGAFDYLCKANLSVEALDAAALRLLRGPARPD